MKPNRGKIDFILFFLTIGMVGFGIVMIYSASFTVSYWDMGDAWYFTRKQLIAAVIGLILMLIFTNISFDFYKKHFLALLVISLALLILVLIPGIGITLNNATSWIGIGPLTFQPSELAKLGLIIYLAALISKKKESITDFKMGLLPCLIVTGIVFLLIALQPDYGTALILLAAAAIIIIVGGARLKHIFYLGMICIVILPVIVLSAGYTVTRFTSFLNPWNDPYDSGYQLIQSLIALGNGGISGTGFGQGIQKFFYLPYSQSDFIFSVIGEELGFIGVISFILVFLFIISRIILISLRSKEKFDKLVGIGIASLFAIQAFINIGGATGTIPITGVPLPFISAGGSSIIVSMISIGIVLSLSRKNNGMSKE